MSMRVGLRDPEGGVQNAFVTSFFMAWLHLGSGSARGHAAGTCDDHINDAMCFTCTVHGTRLLRHQLSSARNRGNRSKAIACPHDQNGFQLHQVGMKSHCVQAMYVDQHPFRCDALIQESDRAWLPYLKSWLTPATGRWTEVCPTLSSRRSSHPR